MNEPRRARREKEEPKRNRKKPNLFWPLVALAYLIITIVFYVSVVKLNLLPTLYFSIFTAIMVTITLAIIVGLVKKHKTMKLNILCLFIAIVLSMGYIFTARYTFATGDFLSNVFQEAVETEEYYVVVKKNNKFNKIEDVNGQDIYSFQLPEDAKQEVEGKTGSKFKTKNNLTDLANDLLKDKVKVICISSTQYEMLGEEVENFKENTKILYSAKHELAKGSVKEENSKYTIENGIFNIYISGIDTEGSIKKVARSDANIIATVNMKKHEILLTSIPRDYYVTLHTYGKKDKLTHSGIYGINETVQTVEDLLDTDINYYLRVNFTTVIKLVDVLGGVDVQSDYAFKTNDGRYTFKKGTNHMNGEEALWFSRERYNVPGGDNQRVKDQQRVIEAILKKTLNSNTILTKYTSLLSSLEGSFQTNIEQEEISKFVKNQLNGMPSWTTKNNALTGTGKSNPTYSMGSQLLYTMIPNEESVADAKQKIKTMLEK